MTSKKRVTHQDVARLAGVSTAVVSYVINNGPRPTSPETRERVLKAIQELDYHPSAFARGLRAQRTNTIGFLVNDYYASTVFLSSYTATILTGVTMYLKEQGYYLLVYPLTIGEDLTDVEILLRSGRLDGIVTRLVQEPPATDRLLDLIAATDIPCVSIEQAGAARFGFSTITYDDKRGAYEATKYLLSQGHRRIAHLCGEKRYATARNRLEGYTRALIEAGIPIDNSLISEGSWNGGVARGSVAAFMSLPEPPTAIFAASDNIAFAGMAELIERGYRIPSDIAMIGFDDIELASQTAPPLTTVRIPLRQIGQRAAELVIETKSELVNGSQTEVMQVELIHRGSA